MSSRPHWAFAAVGEYIEALEAVARSAQRLAVYSDKVPLPLPDSNYGEMWDHLTESLTALERRDA